MGGSSRLITEYNECPGVRLSSIEGWCKLAAIISRTAVEARKFDWKYSNVILDYF